jgi:hypothetical protein
MITFEFIAQFFAIPEAKWTNTQNKNLYLAILNYHNTDCTKNRPLDTSPGLWEWRRTTTEGELLIFEFDTLCPHGLMAASHWNSS